MVKRIEVPNQSVFDEGTCWGYEARVPRLQLIIERCPPRIKCYPFLFILFDTEYLAQLGIHLHSLFKGEGVNLLQNRLQGNQRLLQNLVPVILSEVDNDGDKHGESLVLVSLEDVEEVVVLEETRGAVSHLEVISANALDNTLEEARDEGLNFLNFTDLEHLLELGQEERLFDTVGEGPEL